MRFLFFLAVTLLAQVQVRPSGLTGTVIRQDTGAPLSRATVVLQSEGDRSRGYTVVSSTDGKFSFDDVISGRYRLSATREGYIPAELGVSGPDGCGEPITVEPGRQRTGLSIPMVSAGAIAGRLFDRDGEPASNVSVQAIKFTYQNGSRVLTSIQTAQTNDIGEYRLFYLSPGRYIVAAALENQGAASYVGDLESFFELTRAPAAGAAAPASPPPPAPPAAPAAPVPPTLPGQFVNGRPTGSQPGPRIAPLYYPSSSDPKTATPVELRAGETFQGADMIVTRVELRSIKGNVQSIASRDAFQRMNVSLISAVARPNGGALRSVTVKPDGSFEIPSVFPGSYTLLASGNDSMGRLNGRTSIDVFTTDVQNVQIVVSKGLSLSGRIRSDDSETATRIMGVTLVPVSEDRAIQSQLDLTSKVTNGTFTIDAIPPADYQAWISFNSTVPIYVKSMRLGSSDVRNGFHFDGQSNVPLEIAVGSNGGVVEGAVLSSKGQPVRGATVVLVPDVMLRQRSSSFKTITADSSGIFQISGVGPGDYKLFAWEAVEPGAWEDPDFLRPYEVRGQLLTVGEGSRQSIQLTAIPSTGPVYAQCRR